MFYRLNFIVLHREHHHVRFYVVFLILAGPFLGRPVLCDPLPRGPPTCPSQAIPQVRCQGERPRRIPSPLSLEQNRRRLQQPPSPAEPPPSRGPYSCIPRRRPLRQPFPLRSCSPFPSVPIAPLHLPQPPFIPFLWYGPLVLGLGRPLYLVL